MVMNVEIELRIPTLMASDENDVEKRIDNTHVRFRRVVQVPDSPKPGSEILLQIGEDLAITCTIGKADWHETKQMFVLPCQYPNRRIFPADYKALVNDPHWERVELTS